MLQPSPAPRRRRSNSGAQRNASLMSRLKTLPFLPLVCLVIASCLLFFSWSHLWRVQISGSSPSIVQANQQQSRQPSATTAQSSRGSSSYELSSQKAVQSSSHLQTHTSSSTFQASLAQDPNVASSKLDSGQAGKLRIMEIDTYASQRIVVVGGGLAGLSAALTAATAAQTSGQQLEVLVVDKMDKLGGNSMKASSGINAVNPPAGDSEELFEGDTLRSGGGRSKPDLTHTLAHNSEDAIAWLTSMGITLDGITQLGGHSVPRSRTVTKGANVGFAIMSVLIDKAKKYPGIKIMERSKISAEGGMSARRAHQLEFIMNAMGLLAYDRSGWLLYSTLRVANGMS